MNSNILQSKSLAEPHSKSLTKCLQLNINVQKNSFFDDCCHESRNGTTFWMYIMFYYLIIDVDVIKFQNSVYILREILRCVF